MRRNKTKVFALGSTNYHECNFLVARKKSLLSLSATESSSEDEANGSVENSGKTTEQPKKLGMQKPQLQQLPQSPVERWLILASAFLATLRLLQTMPNSKTGYIEALDLILLAVWTWCIYSIRFPNIKGDGHRVWGTELKCYREEADDGAFYGTLLIPIISVGKLVDVQNSNENGPYIEFFQANTELSILLGSGIILHMFLSKHFLIKRLARIWIITISIGLSLLIYLILAKLERFPLLRQFPWHYIIFSQIFYQLSLYTIANIFKRSFTFGELAILSQSLTLLAVEAWVLTLNELNYIDLPSYMKTSPSPLTIFQIALILGILMIGVLLSPFLLRSRRLAQQPMWKSKDPRGFENEKKWIAFIIYIGTLTIVIGCIGLWVQKILKENPYLWILKFIFASSTRILLSIYWISAVTLSIIFFNQILQGRKGLSLNAKRKYFHALATVMFIPGYLLDSEFMHLAFSVALTFLIFLEYLRYFAVYPLGKQLHIFLSEFLDHRDTGPTILSHLYLLFGCASSVWLRGNSIIAGASGILTLGLGDSMASVIGRRYGRCRWSGTLKTIEGTVAFIISLLMGTTLTVFCAGEAASLSLFQWAKYSFIVILTALLEASSYQNDNLVIPLYIWPMVSLLV
ncbi:hypothetical protein G9A89_023825 [Geosiphon pyriformis]|nr:hypothetical protein G9A89_023825 [Geosiphon pyriformis]